MSAVAVEGVWKFYGDYPALRDIRLEAAPGSCLALIGRNGAGKTTLLRIIAGFSRPMRGKVRILGDEPRETDRAAPDWLHRPRHLGLRRAFGVGKSDALRAAIRLARRAPVGDGVAGAHRP